MRKAFRFTTRFLALVAVIALLQMVVPSAPVTSPYSSALSSVSVGSVYAVPINCPNNSCGGKKGCRSDHGFYCTTSSGGCQTSKCI